MAAARRDEAPVAARGPFVADVADDGAAYLRVGRAVNFERGVGIDDGRGAPLETEREADGRTLLGGAVPIMVPWSRLPFTGMLA